MRAPRALSALTAASLIAALAAAPAAKADPVACSSFAQDQAPLFDPFGYRWDVDAFTPGESGEGPLEGISTPAVAAGTTDFPATGDVPDSAALLGARYGVFGDGGAEGPDGTPPSARYTDDSYDGWGALYVGGTIGDEDDVLATHRYGGTDSAACATTADGRVLILQTVGLDGLQVQRRVGVSAEGGPAGARLVNLLHNPTDQPITTRVQVGDGETGDLGSDGDTAVVTSSSGDDVLDAADRWGVTEELEGTDATLGHVFDGSTGADRIDEAGFAGDADALYYRWNDVTLQPGETAAFLSIEAQSATAERDVTEETTGLTETIAAYDAAPAALYAGLDAATIAAVRNWAKPKPTVAIQGAEGDQTAGKAATFTAAATPALEQCPITAASWDFGDGTTADGAQVAHAFAAGDWKVTLAVTDACGQTAVAERSVHVTPAPAVTAGTTGNDQQQTTQVDQSAGKPSQQGSQTSAASPLLAVNLFGSAKLKARTRAVTLGSVRCLKKVGTCARVRGALYVHFETLGITGQAAKLRLLRLNLEATSVGAGKHHALVLRLGPKARAALSGSRILRARTVVRAADLPLPVSRQVDLSR